MECNKIMKMKKRKKINVANSSLKNSKKICFPLIVTLDFTSFLQKNPNLDVGVDIILKVSIINLLISKNK